MKKKVLSLLTALLILAASAVPAFADEMIETQQPEITNSKMAVLYEASTDTYLYKKNENIRNAPASMTKVMTATLVLDYDPEMSGSTVVSEKAISNYYCYWMDSYHLEAGEECTVNDLMHYLLICSGNEAATVLAEYVAGDIDTFIGMMNARAEELGMTGTFYYDPHGLSDSSHITAEDMLILSRFAMENYPQIREIVTCKDGAMPISNMRSKPLRYSTTNKVMNPGSHFEYMTGFEDDIIGLKTGSTNAAGLNFSCVMVHDDLTFYSVVMHAGEATNSYGVEYSGHMADTASLMKWARSFHKQSIAAGTPAGTTLTSGSREANVKAVTGGDICILTQEDVAPVVEFYELGSSVKAGEEIGSLSLSDQFGNVRTIPLVAESDASTSYTFMIIPMVCLTLIIAMITYKVIRRKQTQKGAPL